MRFIAPKVLWQPVKNLNAFERLILCIRMISMFFCIALSLTLTIGPFVVPRSLYMSQLNTDSSNIAAGIFSTLSSEIEAQSTNNVNNGVGLTTSELFILTSYSLKQVTAIPQYISIYLYGMCSIYHSDSDDALPTFDGQADSFTFHNAGQKNYTVITKCYTESFDYVLDYREILLNIGLDIIIDYAYGSTDGDTPKVGNGYENYINNLKRNKKRYLILFFVVIVMHLISFPLVFWYYFIKGKYINTFKEKLLLNILSLFSLATFVMGLISSLDIVWFNYSLKKKIISELSTFGFSYELGNLFFALIWTLVFFLSISCMAWSGLEWCVADANTIDDVYLNESSAAAMIMNPSNSDALLDETFESDLEENRIDHYYNDEHYDDHFEENDDGYLDTEQADFLRNSSLKEAFQNSKRNTSRKKNDNKNNGFIYDDDLDEGYEMQSIAIISSNESDSLMQYAIVPSSTMNF